MDDNDRDDLIRRLFALLTAKCEDGALFALEGQATHKSDRKALAAKLRSTGDEISCVAEAIQALVAD